MFREDRQGAWPDLLGSSDCGRCTARLSANAADNVRVRARRSSLTSKKKYNAARQENLSDYFTGKSEIPPHVF
jgi:hypothetical protein